VVCRRTTSDAKRSRLFRLHGGRSAPGPGESDRSSIRIPLRIVRDLLTNFIPTQSIAALLVSLRRPRAAARAVLRSEIASLLPLLYSYGDRDADV